MTERDRQIGEEQSIGGDMFASVRESRRMFHDFWKACEQLLKAHKGTMEKNALMDAAGFNSGVRSDKTIRQYLRHLCSEPGPFEEYDKDLTTMVRRKRAKK